MRIRRETSLLDVSKASNIPGEKEKTVRNLSQDIQ
jgi:hypothetical protein